MTTDDGFVEMVNRHGIAACMDALGRVDQGETEGPAWWYVLARIVKEREAGCTPTDEAIADGLIARYGMDDAALLAGSAAGFPVGEKKEDGEETQ